MHEDQEARLPPLLRQPSSGLDEPYSGSCFASPIWYAVMATTITVAPMAMTLSIISQLQKDQFGNDAYWIANISMILQSLASAPCLALCGYLSQPHRYGRKNVMLTLLCISIISSVTPVITQNAYIIVGVQTGLAFAGIDKNSSTVLMLLMAWCTDWCRPEDKTKYFAIVLGSVFAAIALSPFVPRLFGIEDTEGIFMCSAAVRLAAPLVFALIFPKQMSMSQAPQSPVTPAASLGVKNACQHICSSAKYLFTRQFTPTVLYLMVNFTDAASNDSCTLFLMKERHFEVADTNIMVMMAGAFGFFLICIGVPALTACGVKPQTMLLVAVCSMSLHFAVYAFVLNKTAILALEPLSSLGYVALIAATAIVSGESDDAELPRDQGTLMGVFNAMKLIASCVGPLLLASMISAYKSFPVPFNFSGIGFVVLSMIMLVGVGMGLHLRFCSRTPAATVKSVGQSVTTGSDAVFSDATTSVGPKTAGSLQPSPTV